MSHMVRKQIYISERQLTLLRRLAAVRGVSEAEVVRQAIDRETSAISPSSPQDNHNALTRLVQAALQRQEAGITGTPYRWNRDDAYEERIRRFDHPDSAALTEGN